MRTKITLIFWVCILVGCAKNADIESVNVPVEPASQTVLPKISKDISVFSADDAIKVANLFAHGNVLTKSETLKDVRNVVPIEELIMVNSASIYNGSLCMFHHNWGWGGSDNGYYMDYNVTTSNGTYSNFRKELIIEFDRL